MAHDIFLSYASEDFDFISELASGLRAAGLSVWLDRDKLKTDDGHGSIIETALTESRFAIAVISKMYLQKHWPEAEFGAIRKLEAHEKRDRIIVVFHGAPASEFGAPFERSPVKHTLSSDKGVDWVVCECVRLIEKMTAEQGEGGGNDRNEYIFPLGRYSRYGDSCPECGARIEVGSHHIWCNKCDYIDQMEPV
ncbi:MAG: toll/interleukin-1 receptor domain-containing protein [Desulfobacterales bacterium]